MSVYFLTISNAIGKQFEKYNNDLVVYITSPRSIKSTEGTFKIYVSAFSPIFSVTINQKIISVGNESYEFSYIYFNNQLKPGENSLLVEVNTDSGTIEKEFKIFLEDSFYKFSEMRKLMN